MHESEFLPQWYAHARKRRLAAHLRCWLVVMLGLGFSLWMILLQRNIPTTKAAVTERLTPIPAATPVCAVGPVDRWIHTPVGPMIRNLFSINADYFPINPSRSAGPTGPVDEIRNEVAKSTPAQADLRKERELKVERLRKAAASLSLQSTMTRPTGKAVVGGRMVEVDDTVDGFRVVRITTGGIVVERGGIRLEIRFK